jgi:hypothetical protein
MKKLLLVPAIIALFFASPTLAATKKITPNIVKTTIAKKVPKKVVIKKRTAAAVLPKPAAKGQTAPPGYLEFVIKAKDEYMAAKKHALANKSKAELEAAEKAYTAALEEASNMLGS